MIHPAHSSPYTEDNSTAGKFRNLCLAPQIFVFARLFNAVKTTESLKPDEKKGSGLTPAALVARRRVQFAA
jgi:hypothetical protein